MSDRVNREIAAFGSVLLVLGAVLLARYATLELNSDDRQWLGGGSPTVFDNYRYVPRLIFHALNVVAGPNAAAALCMSFAVHAINTLLVGVLSLALTDSRFAAKISAAIFMINPLTLFTLTWISCFSYLIGGTFCLVAVLSFLRGTSTGERRSLAWSGLAMTSYSAGLLCCHEMLFLPVVFAALAWARRGSQASRAWVVVVLSGCVAILVNSYVYNFSQYGIQSGRLLSWDFAEAFGGSIVSFGASLALAYPVSFFMKFGSLLRFCFEEPGRWMITLVVALLLVHSYRPNRAWRIELALTVSLSALIAPYIIRLFLMPDFASYHISYVLSGRVFYVPFILIAIMAGQTGALLQRRPIAIRALLVLSVIAYGSLLMFVYEPGDFLGLQVVTGYVPNTHESTWTPFAGHVSAWPTATLLIVTYSLLRRWRNLVSPS